MGRRQFTKGDNEKVRLFRVNLFDGYDSGGAYWGIGAPLYCAMGEDFEAYRRAANRDAAKQQLLSEFPNLKFFR